VRHRRVGRITLAPITLPAIQRVGPYSTAGERITLAHGDHDVEIGTGNSSASHSASHLRGLRRADLHQPIAANSFITFCTVVTVSWSSAGLTQRPSRDRAREDHGGIATVRHCDIRKQLSAIYPHSARTHGASAEIEQDLSS